MRLKRGIDLIGAVDGDIDHPGMVGSMRAIPYCPASAAVSCEVGTPRIFRPVVTFSPNADDQVLGGGTGAQADDHPVRHIIDRCERCCLLQAVEI